MRGAETREEEVDETLETMEKIARKAKPKEHAEELIRRFRDARSR